MVGKRALSRQPEAGFSPKRPQSSIFVRVKRNWWLGQGYVGLFSFFATCQSKYPRNHIIAGQVLPIRSFKW